VYRTVKVKLNLDGESKKRALLTMEKYTDAFRIAAGWGFQNKEYNKLRVHHGTYYLTRKEIPDLPASLVESAKDLACESLKKFKLQKVPRRRPHAAIRFNQTAMKAYFGSQWLNFLAVGITRIHSTFTLPECYYKYSDWNVKGGFLMYSKEKDTFFFGIIVEKRIVRIVINGDVLGIDRGLRNIAVCSNNQFFSSNHLRNVKGKYEKLRAELQEKGTRSARQRLKQLAGKERRFVACENHRMTKEIVKTNYSTFVLEDLSGIQDKWTCTKRLSKQLHSWSFWLFEFDLFYKAEEAGKKVIWVDPNFTSQRCSSCGYIHSENRVGAAFRCKKCGNDLNADLNAARNLAQLGRTELSRLQVREPHVTHQGEENMLQGKNDLGCSHELSRISNGHSVVRINGSLSLGRTRCFQEFYFNGVEENKNLK
jgi:putative transposase